MAAEPVLIGESSYESFVEGNYIVYTNYSDDPYDRDPELIRYGLYKGRPVYYHHLPLSNIYLYNISSGETTPVYKSGCRSIIPWIENDTVFWFEDRRSPVFYDLKDPNPLNLYLYSVPLGDISPAAAENYSLLNPRVNETNPAITYNKSLLISPDFSSDLIQIIYDGQHFRMVYNDPPKYNMSQITSGTLLDFAYPQLYDDRIFWEDYRTAYSQIFLYDIKTGRDYHIAPQPFSQYDCSVDGDIISWNTNGGDVYYVNFSGLIEEARPEETPENSPKPTEAGTGALILPVAVFASLLLFTLMSGRDQ